MYGRTSYSGPQINPPDSERWIAPPASPRNIVNQQQLVQQNGIVYTNPGVVQVVQPRTPRQPKWILSPCQIAFYCVFAFTVIAATLYMGTVQLVTYLVLKCNSSQLIFVLAIVGNYALAASIVISIPIICKVRYSIIFTVMMYIFGLGSLGCNIAFIILVLIKSGKHFGDCYMRQNLQYFMVALSGLEIFLIADVLCYILVIRRRIQHTRMFDQLARPVR